MGYEFVGGLVNDAGIDGGLAFNMLRLNPGVENLRCLATFFNFEINGLADRFLMEMEEKVNMQRKAPGDSTGEDILQGMAECGGEETRELSI